MPGPAEVPTSYLIAAAPTVPQWVRILDELRTKSMGHLLLHVSVMFMHTKGGSQKGTYIVL